MRFVHCSGQRACRNSSLGEYCCGPIPYQHADLSLTEIHSTQCHYRSKKLVYMNKIRVKLAKPYLWGVGIVRVRVRVNVWCLTWSSWSSMWSFWLFINVEEQWRLDVTSNGTKFCIGHRNSRSPTRTKITRLPPSRPEKIFMTLAIFPTCYTSSDQSRLRQYRQVQSCEFDFEEKTLIATKIQSNDADNVPAGYLKSDSLH